MTPMTGFLFDYYYYYKYPTYIRCILRASVWIGMRYSPFARNFHFYCHAHKAKEKHIDTNSNLIWIQTKFVSQ